MSEDDRLSKLSIEPGSGRRTAYVLTESDVRKGGLYL